MCRTIAGVHHEQFASWLAPLLQAVYDFWQYKLCDVFIELMKPVMRSGDAHAQQVTRETLYICLEVGLRSARITNCS